MESTDLVDAEGDEGVVGRLAVVGCRRGGDARLGGGCGDGEPGVGEHGEGDVAVPGMPEADLVVVEADLVLGRLEALLDGPANADDGDQLIERGVGLRVADEVGELGGVGEGTPDEEPVAEKTEGDAMIARTTSAPVSLVISNRL